jgi:hypothetical protein
MCENRTHVSDWFSIQIKSQSKLAHDGGFPFKDQEVLHKAMRLFPFKQILYTVVFVQKCIEYDAAIDYGT